MNHALLYAAGVSNGRLEELVYEAREAGALGAKFTSAAGGRCMIALTAEGRLQDVAEAIERWRGGFHH